MSAAASQLGELSPQERRELLARLLAEKERGLQPEPDAGPSRHPYAEFVNPHLAKLLRAFHMDKRFVRGEGTELFDEQGIQYTDFIANFGALPFGYNPKEIWQALHAVEESAEPAFVQPSYLGAAGELARRLIEIAPKNLRYVTFTNSGAESAEAAMKLARSVTRRQDILSTRGGFHGKTLAALSATGRSEYQEPFALPLAGFDYVPYGDLEALRAKVQKDGYRFAAFFVEPIQGEGGIRVPPPGYLRGVRELLSQHGILLVVDEVQTGLGRTGSLFACTDEGVEPDLLLLAKALGGGLMPIGAVLASPSCYTRDFALKHSSTFAANALACRAGLRTLELLTTGDLLPRVRENGDFLLSELRKLQRRYPDLVTDVRGRGYLIGIELTDQQDAFAHRCILSCMAESEDLAIAACAYLLDEHRFRVMTTLNGARVLRVEPPLIATREQCERFIGAVADTLGRLRACDAGRIFAHVVGKPVEELSLLPELGPQPSGFARPGAEPDEGRWAFVTHTVDCQSMAEFDPSLGRYSEAQLARLLHLLQQEDDPVVFASAQISSRSGQRSYGEFLNIPYSAEELLAMPVQQAVALVRRAVECARDRGAKIVGLGAYTSIITRNGLSVRDLGVAVTTGNSFTVAATEQALLLAAAQQGLDLSTATLAILGAAGSIGRALALLLAERAGRLLLIGNPAHPEQSLKQLREVARAAVERLRSATSDAAYSLPIRGSLDARLRDLAAAPADEQVAELERAGLLVCTTELDAALPQAHCIVTATSTPQKLVHARHLRSGALVLDTAEPSNLDPAVRRTRSDVTVIEGGVIEVPDRQDLGFSFRLPPGHVYACMAEAMMLGLERRYQHATLGGEIDAGLVQYTRELGEKHGFRIRPLSELKNPDDRHHWSPVI